jgi:lipoprotein-anchoring transpeptidase ErfK/SrfK
MSIPAISIQAISTKAMADPLQVAVYPYGGPPVYAAQQPAPAQVYYYVQQPRYAAAPGNFGGPNYGRNYAAPGYAAPAPQGYAAPPPQPYRAPQGYAAPAQAYPAPAPQTYAAPAPQPYAAAASQSYAAAAPPPAPSSGGGFLQAIFGGPTINVPVAHVYPYQTPQSQPQPLPPVQQASYSPANPADESSYPIDPRFLRQVVAYNGPEKPGTIIVDTPNKFLYLVEEGGRAMRYGIGVGRPGFTWAGEKTITAMKKWPDWTPPPEMIARQPQIPHFMQGGLGNPLGSRALYLGSTLYRIHGSNEPWTIGQNVSSGCIRMRNADVEDLFDRVHVGTKVEVM